LSSWCDWSSDVCSSDLLAQSYPEFQAAWSKDILAGQRVARPTP
jgi:hypothetical protein